MIKTSTDPKLKWVEWVSYLMDEKFRLPGTNFRFGLDPLLNLIPGVGDLSGFIVSSVLVITMARHGVSKKVLLMMSLNVVLDTVIGAIPLIGQIFDFAYKSNTRNIRLLQAHYQEGKYQGSGKGILITIVLAFTVLLILIIYLIYGLINWLIHLSGY